MTRKDWVGIEGVIANHDFDCEQAEQHRKEITIEFADYLASESKQFDRERFLKACGVEGAE